MRKSVKLQLDFYPLKDRNFINATPIRFSGDTKLLILVATVVILAVVSNSDLPMLLSSNNLSSFPSAFICFGRYVWTENQRSGRKAYEYYVAAEPPVRCGESHHSGQTEPPCY